MSGLTGGRPRVANEAFLVFSLITLTPVVTLVTCLSRYRSLLMI
jgi:hypothetical protein